MTEFGALVDFDMLRYSIGFPPLTWFRYGLRPTQPAFAHVFAKTRKGSMVVKTLLPFLLKRGLSQALSYFLPRLIRSLP